MKEVSDPLDGGQRCPEMDERSPPREKLSIGASDVKPLTSRLLRQVDRYLVLQDRGNIKPFDSLGASQLSVEGDLP